MSEGLLIDRPTFERIARAVRAVEARKPRVGAAGFDSRHDSWGGQAQIRYGTLASPWTGGDTVTLTPCLSATDDTAIDGADDVTCSIYCQTGQAGPIVATDGTILAFVDRDPTATPPTGWLVNPPVRVMLPVSLSSDGGAGTAASPYTYTAALEGVTLGTGLAPAWRPIAADVTGAASVGTGYFTGTTFSLYSAAEAFDVTTCT